MQSLFEMVVFGGRVRWPHLGGAQQKQTNVELAIARLRTGKGTYILADADANACCSSMTRDY